MSHPHRSAAATAAIMTLLAVLPASADKIANKVAVFTGLDKITGRIITFDVYIDETVQFGMLRVTPKVCYSRPVTEAAATDAFVQVDEITLSDEVKRIFDGWMFASSPGLNAVQHPVYDVWLKDCRMESDIPPPTAHGGAPRMAKANDVPGAGDGDLRGGQGDEGSAAGGVTTINGIPIPPVKPKPGPMDGIGVEPDDQGAAPSGEILD